jgi:hypothetical protein
MKLHRAILGLSLAAVVSPLWGQEGGAASPKSDGSSSNVTMGEGGGLGGGKSQGKGGDRGACQDDTNKFCSDQRAKGHDAVHACLKKHLKDISADCKKHLQKSKPHSKKAKTVTNPAPANPPSATSAMPPPGTGQ